MIEIILFKDLKTKSNFENNAPKKKEIKVNFTRFKITLTQFNVP